MKKNVKYFCHLFFKFLKYFTAFPAKRVIAGVLGPAVPPVHLPLHDHLSQADDLHHPQTHQHWLRSQEGEDHQEKDKPGDCRRDHEPHRHYRLV